MRFLLSILILCMMVLLPAGPPAALAAGASGVHAMAAPGIHRAPRVPLAAGTERVLERYRAKPGGIPVILVPGLFLETGVYKHGPYFGLANYLRLRGFDVWLWSPWRIRGGMDNIVAGAIQAAKVVATETGREPRWVGMDMGMWIGLRAASRGALISAVAGIGPRLEPSPCPALLLEAFQLTSSRPQQLIDRVMPLLSWGDVPKRRLNRVMHEDGSTLSEQLSMELARACRRAPAPVPSPTDEKGAPEPLPTSLRDLPEGLWLGFWVSPRDGMAPLERLLPRFDGLSSKIRRLEVSGRVPAPSHLGLVQGRGAGRVYRTLAKWLKHPAADRREPLPVVPLPEAVGGTP